MIHGLWCRVPWGLQWVYKDDGEERGNNSSGFMGQGFRVLEFQDVGCRALGFSVSRV